MSVLTDAYEARVAAGLLEGDPAQRAVLPEFDRIAAGYTGPLYAEICPRSFSVLVAPGQRLNQIRFRDGKAALDHQSDVGALPRHQPGRCAEHLVAGGRRFGLGRLGGRDRRRRTACSAR